MLLCQSRIMESETEIYRGGWIYSRTLKYLFKASFFSDSYLQHYLNRLYREKKLYMKSDIWAPP